MLINIISNLYPDYLFIASFLIWVIKSYFLVRGVCGIANAIVNKENFSVICFLSLIILGL